MADSFFTARNYVDRHFATFSASQSEIVLEAAVRQLAKQATPRNAAEKLYRLADICAAEELGELKIKKPRKRSERIIAAVAAHGYWFAAGMAFNMLLRELPRWVS